MASMFCRKAILPIPWLSIQPKTDTLITRRAGTEDGAKTALITRGTDGGLTLLGNGGEPVDGADGSVFLIALGQ